MRHRAFRIALVAGLWAGATWASDIGFVEDFALAQDRTVPLKQLIPGTEDYYYYHCLHHQNSGDHQKVHEVLGQWIKRHKYTARVKEMQNRQALLEYETAPEKTLQHIRDRLRLRFDHQKQQLEKKTNHPTVLDASLISWKRLAARAFARYRGKVQGFEDSALDLLAAEKLDADQRRDFLRRLQRPDIPGLADMVVDDLNHRNSRGFGSHKIHRALTLEQLERCIRKMPKVLNDATFVNTYLSKLTPGADADRENDPAEKGAFLQRLLTFVQRLAPAHNSLKAHVLYRQLEFDLSRGTWDRKRFLEYLQLPRAVPYIRSDYVNRPEHRHHRANLNADFRQYTLMPPVRLDEPLVRRCLQHFLLDAANYDEFARVLDSNYVKRVFAETKILNGVGDQERWYSLLSAAEYKALKDRVDLEFLPTNRTVWATAEPVTLQVAVKNVRDLIIKIYRINTFNAYRGKLEEISTGIDLDGLVANVERKTTYKQVELRRHVETFEFPEINGPGVYVVELIGNGRSSRALIRKGRLTLTERQGAAGHVFRAYNERNERLTNARLWFGGQEYTPDEGGEIVIPYASRSSTQKVIVLHNSFAALHQFRHAAEIYTLSAGIAIDREALIAGATAQVMIRPELLLNGRPTDLDLLEETALVIESTDHEGISSSKEVTGFELHNDRESLYEFRVPEKLARLAFTLRGRIQVVSRNEKQNLTSSAAVALNRIDTTEKVEDLHLRHVDGSYTLELRGRNGEAKADRAVHFELKHRHVRQTEHVVLQTDERGRVRLGTLTDITWVLARGPEDTSHRWQLGQDVRSRPRALHALAGEALRMPVMQALPQKRWQGFSLLELRGNTPVKDWTDSVKTGDAFLRVEDIPAGDYLLTLKQENAPIHLRITAGRRDAPSLLSRARLLEDRAAAPLQIVKLETDAKKDELRVLLANTSAATRVHVVATRFVPEIGLFGGIGAPARPAPWIQRVRTLASRYLSGRNIGDEYRYILERRQADIYPGNMLRRPELLLNPWNLRKTDTGTQEAAKGAVWGDVAADAAMAPREVRASDSFGGRRARSADGKGLSNLDFLEQPSLVLANLRPDANGVVTVKLSSLGTRRHVQALAIDPFDSVCRELALPDTPPAHRDLRQLRPLDPARHYSEQKSIDTVKAGADFAVEDIRSARFEVYDSLASVYSLLATLSDNTTLTEFNFILGWPDLDADRQRELYAKYACHELNFFLSRKDPAFFTTVIKPYLRNKKDKTFIDHYLLGSDLSPYLRAWDYQRLNVVERILLTQRLTAQAPVTARHVKDMFDLIPPDYERFNRLFKTAVKGSALETEDAFGLAEALAEVADDDDDAMGFAEPTVVAGPRVALRRAKQEKAMEKTLDAPAPVRMLAKKKSRTRRAAMSIDFEAKADRQMEAEGLMANLAADRARRKSVRQLYRKLDKTEEWVENNYYRLPIEKQVADLVTVNGFWRDYAAHSGDAPFLSAAVAEATRNFTEMMFALAVLDLPFKPLEHKTAYEQARLRLTPGSDVVIYHKQIRDTEQAETPAPMLVSQNFLAHNDRYRHEDNERFDKFVTDEFQTHRVYGCQVVLTNPTSSRRKVDVLLQVPSRAIPVLSGFYTRSLHRQLDAYSTQTVEYHFYFPAAGDWAHYPVHVAEKGEVIAAARPFTFHVVGKLTKIDTTSWWYISQNGSSAQVLEYLRDNNVNRLDLDLIAFRMRDKDFFEKAIGLLDGRHIYSDVLWSYGVLHNHLPSAQEYLRHSPYATQCGMAIASPLLTVNPVARHTYQHREYHPLVNPRVYPLGGKRKILNRQLHHQYHEFMRSLACRAGLDDADLAAVTYYLFLQDRVKEALAFFDRVNAEKLDTRIQYDYLKAYAAFYRGRPTEAQQIARKYEQHGVDRWRKRFLNVLAQVAETQGGSATVVDIEDRDQQQTKLADTAPSLDLKVEDRRITLTHRNLAACRINYFLMDIELLFSRQPFVKEVSGQFAIIHPNDTADVKLPAGQGTTTVELPAKYRDQNVMVEVAAGGVVKTQAYYPHSLGVQLMETHGQMRISHLETGRPLGKVYAKVYARMKGGKVRFYKDGYTDLRGRFDYTSLNTNELDQVERFAVLIMSEENGAVIREAAPPKM